MASLLIASLPTDDDHNVEWASRELLGLEMISYGFLSLPTNFWPIVWDAFCFRPFDLC